MRTSAGQRGGGRATAAWVSTMATWAKGDRTAYTGLLAALGERGLIDGVVPDGMIAFLVEEVLAGAPPEVALGQRTLTRSVKHPASVAW